MSYEELWVVTFRHPSYEDDKIHVTGPFPAEETAEDFARRLREAWPAGEDASIGVSQLEATDPIEDLTVGDR